MQEKQQLCAKHVFVCVNERPTEGSSCCKKVGGMEVFRALKQFVLSNAPHIWVSKSGCLGFCNDIGTSIVVYPEQKWFLEVKQEDVEKIIEYLKQEV